MGVGVYINFTDKTAEAIKFYESALDGKISGVMKFGDIPPSEEMPIDEKTKDLILHANVIIEGDEIMFSDMPESMRSDFIEGNNITIMLQMDDKSKMQKYYDNLSKEGKVVMELQKTFWSPYYAFVIDKFGIGWQLDMKVECDCDNKECDCKNK